MANRPSSLPLIIAHRGASGLRPEHTLEAYLLAAELGADVIEPDLVFTKDGHLICRHDRYLSGSTNVSALAQFAGRKTVKAGHVGPDWFAEDFTLAEIKMLKARQAFPGRAAIYDDRFEIPPFADLLSLAKQKRWRLYPEAKEPGAAAANGHDFLAALQPFFSAVRSGDIGPSFLQCFDPAFTAVMPNMRNLARIQLLGGDVLTEAQLAAVAAMADGIGPHKSALLTPNGQSTGVLERAQTAGLKVHPYTFRTDAVSMPFADAQSEFNAFFALGVDGLFTDFTGDAVSARQAWLSSR